MAVQEDTLIGCLAAMIDRVVPDQAARDAAKVRLVALASRDELSSIFAVAESARSESRSADGWVRRARPSFLYVMYAMVLGSIPIGFVAAGRPDLAGNIASGISAYFHAIPDPLYALFGTGYLGYTAARQWGKIAGSDR